MSDVHINTFGEGLSFESSEEDKQFIAVELTDQDMENIRNMHADATLYIVMPDTWDPESEEFLVMDNVTDALTKWPDAYKRGQKKGEPPLDDSPTAPLV